MDRDFSSAAPPALLGGVLMGLLTTTYRGWPFQKSPFDAMLYLQLIQRLKPKTIIEIGSFGGGSALFFADMMQLHHGAGRVVSIDVEARERPEDPRLTFLGGDALRLGETLSEAVLADLPRPWLVSEDSAHLFETSLAVLDFFDPQLASGEYIVVEDGFVAGLPDFGARYDDGPNRAVRDFLERRGEDFEVDASLCDLYGRNVTLNPNGWIRRR